MQKCYISDIKTFIYCIFYPGRLQVQTLQFRPVSSPLAKLTAYWQYLVLSIFLLTASHGLHHMTYEYLIM